MLAFVFYIFFTGFALVLIASGSSGFCPAFDFASVLALAFAYGVSVDDGIGVDFGLPFGPFDSCFAFEEEFDLGGCALDIGSSSVHLAQYCIHLIVVLAFGCAGYGFAPSFLFFIVSFTYYIFK